MHLITARLSLVLIAGIFTITGRLTSAVQVITTNVESSKFYLLKTVDNDAVCAIGSTPFMNLTASPMYCSSKCQQQASLSSCDGFNYRSSSSICELYNDTQSAFSLRRGCIYFKVIFLLRQFENFR